MNRYSLIFINIGDRVYVYHSYNIIYGDTKNVDRSLV